MGIKQKIVKFMEETGYKPMSLTELMDSFNISKGEQQVFCKILDEMEKEGLLYKTRRGKYGLPEKMNMLLGTYQGNPRGFGFLIQDNKDLQDVYISPEDANGAMDGDRILVRPIKGTTAKDKCIEGEVVKILKRTNQNVVGTFEASKHFGFVVPDNKRIFYDIFVPKEEFNGAKTDHKVVVEITRWPEKRRNPEGRVIEVLGHKDDVGTDVLSIIRQYNLPEGFPEEVIKEARMLPKEVTEQDLGDREDLRNIKVATIDNEDAKDLDDAVSIMKTENGTYKLGVHIADVSHYVKPNKAIDREALERGCSIYLVDRVIPMLPYELSNGICSLNPREDRLTLSVFMEIDSGGRVINHRIAKTVINSCERMTYTDLTRILVNKDRGLMERYDYLIPEFYLMQELCQILKKRRMARGSIDFDLDEARIKLDLKGRPIEVEKDKREISHQIIEEFMLICNETVAEYIYWTQIPFIYRIHEEPDAEKLLEFNDFIHNFGYRLKGTAGEIHPKTLQELLTKIRGTKEETIISKVMLRSLQQARYSVENLGHFGLATRYYTHFTAPIRRYPDLQVHRIVKEIIKESVEEKWVKKLNRILPNVAEQSSKRERIAQEVERETEDLKKAEFMYDKVGEVYEGIISGVTSYGIYVELENTVEGLVRVSTMDDDYYVYNEKHYCFIGERTRKVYRLGDAVKVKVSRVDIANREIDFLLVDE
ncbi:MAG TPA: ribonuclease R [Clostridiales bacterium]|nr:ribonuclease R [Clostridiales bacterium]